MIKKIQILVLAILVLTIFTSCSIQEEKVNNVENNFEENKNQEQNLEEETLEDSEFEMTTEDYCLNKCGDGICDTLTCSSYDCPCEETKENCPIDCN